jgi:hypothetical protein
MRLNPHKCIFCVVSRILLGFIVSKYRILVDPLKVKAIFKLPPPRTIIQLQSLQGKEIFLHQFISNYIDIMKCFMCLLKKGVPFMWDYQAQWSFDVLKKAFVSTLYHGNNRLSMSCEWWYSLQSVHLQDHHGAPSEPYILLQV